MIHSTAMRQRRLASVGDCKQSLHLHSVLDVASPNASTAGASPFRGPFSLDPIDWQGEIASRKLFR